MPGVTTGALVEPKGLLNVFTVSVAVFKDRLRLWFRLRVMGLIELIGRWDGCMVLCCFAGRPGGGK